MAQQLAFNVVVVVVALIAVLSALRSNSPLGFHDWFWLTVGPLVEAVQPQFYDFQLGPTVSAGTAAIAPLLAAALKRERGAARRNAERLFSQDMRDAGRFVSAYDVHLPSRNPKRLIPGTVVTPPIGNKTAGLPLVIFIHSGWLVYGDRVSELSTMRLIAQQLPAVVVSVEYRLAPEHPFPSAFHDCADFVEHVLSRSGALGPTLFNRSQVVAVGYGAGGYLASLLALSLAERNVSIAGHVSVSPMMGPFKGFASHLRHFSVPFHGGKVAEWAWGAYLQGTPPMRWDWRVSPLLATDAHLAACAPGAVVLHSLDALRDEGALHARRLEEQGRLSKLVELHLPHATVDGFERELLEVMSLLQLLASPDAAEQPTQRPGT